LTVDFTVKDATGASWTLSDHLDSAVVITFHRGDF
jgi:peroxiredoxin